MTRDQILLKEQDPQGLPKRFSGCGASGNLLTASLSRFFITWTALRGVGVGGVRAVHVTDWK